MNNQIIKSTCINNLFCGITTFCTIISSTNLVSAEITPDIAIFVSDISANSENSRGGNIQINALGIFGTQFRQSPTPQSDITATGASEDLSGNVEIITPRTDINSGLVELLTVPIENKVADACSNPGYAQSSFTITGKGSLPPSPFEPLTGRLNQTKLATLEGEIKPQARRTRKKKKQQPQIKRIVEAQGWVRTPNGEIMLVAYNPQNTTYSSPTTSKSCSYGNG